MVAAAETVGRFVGGRARSDLDSDEMLLFAVVRAVEVIGEAAAKVSAETRSELPTIPWARIIAMRNRLIHAYHDIDRTILWKTMTEEIPVVLALLRNALPRA